MKDWCLGELSKLVWRVKLLQNWLRNVQFPTLPAHHKWGKGSTRAAEGMLGATDALVSWVDFFVKMGRKLGKVPIKSLFWGTDGMYSAIQLLQHGATNPLSPCPPSRLDLAGWLEGADKSEKWSAR